MLEILGDLGSLNLGLGLGGEGNASSDIPDDIFDDIFGSEAVKETQAGEEEKTAPAQTGGKAAMIS